MDYPSKQEVQDLIEDYERDFGVRMPFEDARKMLVFYDGLCALFEKHGGYAGGYEMPALPPSPLA